MTSVAPISPPYSNSSGYTSTSNMSPNSAMRDLSHTNMNAIENEVAVKVAVRVRPLNNREKIHQHQPCVRISAENNQLAIGKDKVFTFDHVLPPKITQQDLYETCVKNLVQNVFEGYNATVFAYGQTGSGKTHTISGNKTSPDEYGIIPRAVNTMFNLINQANGGRTNYSNREFCVKINFIEIYKEELKDLLDPSDDKTLQIREDESGNTVIYGANEVICTTLEEVMTCFDAGTLLRHTGSTLMNEQSSRSHSVFTVSIEQRWTDSNDAKTIRESAIYDLNSNNQNSNYYLGAKFHFVDLAGSERVHRTGNVGDRFKESIHINTGLLALGNVISALSSSDTKKKVHIPYRESKITRILKDSLGGNANTLMICCISPSSVNLDESINALKYASRARYIKNKPIVNMDPHTQKFVEMQSEIQALREELQRQRTTLLSATQHFHSHVNQFNNNEEELKDLEKKLEESQMELEQFKKLAKEAFSRFLQLNSISSIPMPQRKVIEEWLSMFEAIKNRSDFDIEDYAKQKIAQLEAQLKQAQDDLKSDEEIFSDKEKEIKNLSETISDLESKLNYANRYLEQSYQKEKEQQELMLQLQMQIDNLIQSSKNNSNDTIKSNKSDLKKLEQNDQFFRKVVSNSGTLDAKQRAKTAPLSSETNDNQHANTNQTKQNKANRLGAHSSPAVFALERMMQSFRARTQLLAETLEENDNVLQQKANLAQDNQEINEHLELDDEREEEFKFVRRGTFKVEKAKVGKKMNDSKKAESENYENKKLRDLSINIKMKEELIKELVANSKFTNRINAQYQHKIEAFQKEILQYKAEISELNSQIEELRSNKITLLSKTSKEKERDSSLSNTNTNMRLMSANGSSNAEKRVGELELHVGKLKQQIDSLAKRLKEEGDKKLKLEKDLEKEQQKVKDLEIFKEKQQQILKKKTEDLLSAQRRLRSNSSAGLHEPAENSSNANKHWIEQEMENIIQEKRRMELLKEELAKREEFVLKRELLIKEKNELESKKLRSSQLNKELKDHHSSLLKQRKQIDENLNKGDVLSNLEQRRLIEIDEAIEALEIAIQFENDSIKQSLNLSSDNSASLDGVLQKLSTVPHDETKLLVKKFFQKIIYLKEQEQKKQIELSELRVQLDEQNRTVEQLKLGLNTSLKGEKQQTKQINQQLNECKDRIAQLEKEKELYKEKLLKYKSKLSHMEASAHFLESEQNNSSEAFHIKNGNSSDGSASARTIKLSKKDLRRLTDEELTKRSSIKKEHD